MNSVPRGTRRDAPRSARTTPSASPRGNATQAWFTSTPHGDADDADDDARGSPRRGRDVEDVAVATSTARAVERTRTTPRRASARRRRVRRRGEANAKAKANATI